MSLPGQNTPATNPLEVLENIQAWGVGIYVSLVVIAISTAILAGIAVGELVNKRKAMARGRT
jgi:hypothetical protein